MIVIFENREINIWKFCQKKMICIMTVNENMEFTKSRLLWYHAWFISITIFICFRFLNQVFYFIIFGEHGFWQILQFIDLGVVTAILDVVGYDSGGLWDRSFRLITTGLGLEIAVPVSLGRLVAKVGLRTLALVVLGLTKQLAWLLPEEIVQQVCEGSLNQQICEETKTEAEG